MKTRAERIILNFEMPNIFASFLCLDLKCEFSLYANVCMSFGWLGNALTMDVRGRGLEIIFTFSRKLNCQPSKSIYEPALRTLACCTRKMNIFKRRMPFSSSYKLKMDFFSQSNLFLYSMIGRRHFRKEQFITHVMKCLVWS